MTALLAVVAGLVLVPLMSAIGRAGAAAVGAIRDSRRTTRPVAGHALFTGRVRDSRGRVVFWGSCECDQLLRWHGARLPLVWALHCQHLASVRAATMARHPSRRGAHEQPR